MIKINSVPMLNLEDIEFVNRLAIEAGRLALAKRAQAIIRRKDSEKDFVTNADLACSKLIFEQLSQRFPYDALISEEGHFRAAEVGSNRTWMIDPIDGTENYVLNDGMYSVMIGLLIGGRPCYGWVYSPVTDRLYVACPGESVVRIIGDHRVHLPKVCVPLDSKAVRLMMGNRDREEHPWVSAIPGVEFVYSGSVGLRVAMIIEGNADVYVHLTGKLKVWDTAAPAALALAAGLEIGSYDFEGLQYGADRMHNFPIAIGKTGTLKWLRMSARVKPAEFVLNAPIVTVSPH